ncbi:hypothetical protein KUTeg_015698 [Tegillarca granosa]|uniref:Uncharacterized protein n=1 Tax=Tegillarca granosa TaxID=220873 RepID=A0ABQ9ESU5_TEGGR|nr:hypothetical protein KUTeg_015698 [Tegillarca granosa]
MISIYKNGNYDLFNDFFFLFEFILFFKKIFYDFPLCKTCYIFLFKSVINDIFYSVVFSTVEKYVILAPLQIFKKNVDIC